MDLWKGETGHLWLLEKRESTGLLDWSIKEHTLPIPTIS
jgi:hypothetical protein